MKRIRPRKKHPITAAARYERHGPTGFLHPIHLWDVTMGRERVHHGRNKRQAERAFHNWRKCSEAPHGRAAGQSVTLLRDGERIAHHQPEKRSAYAQI